MLPSTMMRTSCICCSQRMLAGSFKLLKMANETQDEEMQRKSSPIIMNKVFQEVSEKQLKKKKQNQHKPKSTKKTPNTKQKVPKPFHFRTYLFFSAVVGTPYESSFCRILCFQPLAVPDHSVFVSFPLLVFSQRANMKVRSGLRPYV